MPILGASLTPNPNTEQPDAPLLIVLALPAVAIPRPPLPMMLQPCVVAFPRRTPVAIYNRATAYESQHSNHWIHHTSSRRPPSSTLGHSTGTTRCSSTTTATLATLLTRAS